MVESRDNQGAAQSGAYRALASVSTLGFRFLAWLNGIGALVIIFSSMGIIQTDLSPYLLRLPLAAFLGGLSLCGVGLFWSYLVHNSLFGQLLAGRNSRGHWLPLFCAMVAYGLSMLAFIAGCWFTLNLAGLVDHGARYSQSSPNGDVSPSDQSGQNPWFEPDTHLRPAMSTQQRYSLYF